MGKTIKAICEVCNKEYIARYRDYIKYNNHYCSRECRYIYNHNLFLDNFNNKIGDLFILLEYENKNKVKVQCKNCGSIYISSSANIVRKKSCSNCNKIRKDKEKEYINNLKQQLKEINENKKELDRLINRLNRALKRCESKEKREKRLRQYWKVNELKRENRIKNNGEIDKDITLEKLYIRDKGICYICNSKCNYDDYKITDKGYFIAGNNYPSIDHIKPLSKGGTHTWNNVRLACRLCNSVKKDKY